MKQRHPDGVWFVVMAICLALTVASASRAAPSPAGATGGQSPILSAGGEVPGTAKDSERSSAAAVVTTGDLIAECTRALGGMDDNLVFETRRCKGRLTITNDEGVRVKDMIIWAKGYYTSYTEFIAPPRDEGTKYLRLDKGKRRLLYMYLPTAEKVIRISGHMLRQSMMGSDWSYEDALESPRLLDSYRVVAGKTTVEAGRACYEMTLEALRPGVTYQRRVVVVEKEHLVPVRQEWYARGGKHLKTITFRDVKTIRGRYYPATSEVRNHLLRTSTSVFELYELEFDVEVPRGVFSRSYLDRGN